MQVNMQVKALAITNKISCFNFVKSSQNPLAMYYMM